MEVGEEVTEVEPEDEGYVTVKKLSGEEGSVSASCLTSTTGAASSPELKEGRRQIKNRHKLIGTKVTLEVGDTVTLLEEEEEDGWVSILTADGEKGHVPLTCLGKLLLLWPGRTMPSKSPVRFISVTLS